MYPVPGMYIIIYIQYIQCRSVEIFNLRKSVDVEHRPAAPRVWALFIIFYYFVPKKLH